MRKSNWTSSMVPNRNDQPIYPGGPYDCAWPETGCETRTRRSFSRTVLRTCAHELRRRCDPQGRDIPFFLQGFTDRFEHTLQQVTRAAGAARF